MESKTKNKQRMETLHEMVSRAFKGLKILDKEDSIIELKEGYFNVAYCIKLEDGKEVILKIAPPGDVEIMSYEKNIMRTEVETMKLVKEKTDVPVPCVYYYDDTKTICSAEYFFMEKIEGINYISIKEKLSENEISEIENQLGHYNKAINEITGEYFGYDGQKEKQGSSWKTVFVGLVNDLLKDGEKKNVDIGLPYEKVIGVVDKFSNYLENIITPHLVHWDLWDGNIFVKNGKITGIIDFERAIWADPLIEHYFKEVDKTSDAFMKGYGKSSFSDEEIIKRVLYNIHLYLIMTIECAYRNYENDGQYNWAKEMLEKESNRINEIKSGQL
jgi:5-methylthioribose kinase